MFDKLQLIGHTCRIGVEENNLSPQGIEVLLPLLF
jgi:hypothetical protein